MAVTLSNGDPHVANLLVTTNTISYLIVTCSFAGCLGENIRRKSIVKCQHVYSKNEYSHPTQMKKKQINIELQYFLMRQMFLSERGFI